MADAIKKLTISDSIYIILPSSSVVIFHPMLDEGLSSYFPTSYVLCNFIVVHSLNNYLKNLPPSHILLLSISLLST